ncbi:MAG TPA: FAD-dependent oxidoreductase [Kofleriaceae bacterium]|nr:FAD-dependent oxidoreductase [Kofleriaceae bacterium]
MSATADVVVAGGGIVGCAVALEAARAGLRVVVVEPGCIGGGATGAAMGHLVVLDDDPVELALCRWSLALWRELLDAPAVENLAAGTLWVAADGAEANAARDKQQRLRDAGLDAEWLDDRALAEAEPLLREGLVGAVRVPGDSVVYPPGAALHLWREAERLGARTIRAAVRALADGAAILDDGTRVSAGAIVLACGLATTALVPGLPMVPRKGHLVVTDRYPGLVRHQLVELGYIASAHAHTGGDSVAMNVQPRPTGHLVIGSSRQFTDDGAVDLAIVDAMLGRAFEYLPGLRRLHALRVWFGFRPTSRDGRPFIGPWPARDRVWLATGHEGLGITTSLATAHLVVDQILSRPSPIDAAPYAPSRALC